MGFKFSTKDWRADQKTYARLMDYMKPYQQRFIIATVASVPASLLEGAIAFSIGPAVDRIKNSNELSFLYVIPVIILVVSFLQGTFEYISDYLSTYVGSSISRDIRRELYRKLCKMDLGYYKRNTSGEVYTRFYGDSTLLQQAIVDNFQGFIIQLFTLVGLASVLFYRNWQLAVVALVIISFIVIPLSIISKKVRSMDYQLRENAATLYNILMETIQGVKEIKAFKLQPFKIKHFFGALDENTSNILKIQKAAIILKPLMQMIATFGVAAIFAYGSYEVNQHKMSIGDLTSFIIALVLLYKPVKVVGGIIGKVQRILAPAERVFQVLDLEPELQDVPNATDITEFNELTFEHVSFSYNTDKTVLSDINFSVRAGESIALVGPSGGGKSTLVDLIPRFMDVTHGQVLINGRDIREISHNTLMNLFAIVNQDSLLFYGTIAENIRMGRLDASDEDLQRAITMANLDDLVNNLPKGIHTPIGERGGMVSGGQKQRIAIARAFLKNAPILILDEATSALDNESEAKVQEALANLMQGRTVIVIAHRLSTIRHADKILVLQRGQIVESGNHDELLALKNLYYSLYMLQFSQATRPQMETSVV